VTGSVWLIVIGIWFLINVLFVVLMVPPRKPARNSNANPPFGKLAPVLSKSKKAQERSDPDQEETKLSFGLMLAAVGMGAFFVLAPLLIYVSDFFKGLFRKKPPSQPL
jgi:hypothetical protein